MRGMVVAALALAIAGPAGAQVTVQPGARVRVAAPAAGSPAQGTARCGARGSASCWGSW